jgi:C4-type Zn-finger protein
MRTAQPCLDEYGTMIYVNCPYCKRYCLLDYIDYNYHIPLPSKNLNIGFELNCRHCYDDFYVAGTDDN